VAERDNVPNPQRVARGYGCELVRARADVLEGPRKAAARPVDAAVLDVPDCDAAPAQVFGGVVHDAELGDIGAPTAAVHHQHHRERSFARGQPEVGHLLGRGSVSELPGGRRHRPSEQIRPVHQWRSRGGGAAGRQRGDHHQHGDETACQLGGSNDVRAAQHEQSAKPCNN